ncbi:MAG: hypothetical protein ACR2KK_22250 [Acidimicrobiales bacterium]
MIGDLESYGMTGCHRLGLASSWDTSRTLSENRFARSAHSSSSDSRSPYSFIDEPQPAALTAT